MGVGVALLLMGGSGALASAAHLTSESLTSLRTGLEGAASAAALTLRAAPSALVAHGVAYWERLSFANLCELLCNLVFGTVLILPELFFQLAELTVRVLALAASQPRRAIGALVLCAGFYLLRRAWGAYRRYRRQRAARQIENVDMATRWVLAQLKAHHQNWASATGSGRGLSLGELQRLLPDEVLPEAYLWPAVIERVDAEHVVKRRSSSQQGEIVWEWSAR